MEMKVNFPDNLRVDAEYKGFTIETDQPVSGGGDGMVETPSGRVYVPYAAPGDRLRLTLRGSEIVEATRLADGPGRVAPACAHFGDCGGCALQHIEDGAYAVNLIGSICLVMHSPPRRA